MRANDIGGLEARGNRSTQGLGGLSDSSPVSCEPSGAAAAGQAGIVRASEPYNTYRKPKHLSCRNTPDHSLYRGFLGPNRLWPSYMIPYRV